mmetsp:Transcript_63132/g.113641  ORF Transcript_63132/g.113641 Transcript_63132/m.113641 type:complete len:565 (-) Transcript_63132:90-1784(-)
MHVAHVTDASTVSQAVNPEAFEDDMVTSNTESAPPPALESALPGTTPGGDVESEMPDDEVEAVYSIEACEAREETEGVAGEAESAKCGGATLGGLRATDFQEDGLDFRPKLRLPDYNMEQSPCGQFDAVAAAANAEISRMQPLGEEEETRDEEQEEELHWLKRERALLFGELGGLKAKFEITLQTLRSILRLQPSCSWADILEQCEALASVKRKDRLLGGSHQSDSQPSDDCCEEDGTAALLLQAEMDLEEREQQLEEQLSRLRDLSDVLTKQQNLLDMTDAKLADHTEQKELVDSQQKQLSELSIDHDHSFKEAEKLREVVQLQEERLHEKDGQVAALEAALAQKELALLRRDQEFDQSQSDCERQRADIEELLEAVALREEDVQWMRAQLEKHEAAERRRQSYRPTNGGTGTSGNVLGGRSSQSTSALQDDGSTSEPGSSASSARPSARGVGGVRYESSLPSTPARQPVTVPAASGDAPRRIALRPAQPLVTMDKQERAAFLTHFPMASRTERHLRTRIEDSARRSGLSVSQGVLSSAANGTRVSPGSALVNSPLASARTMP